MTPRFLLRPLAIEDLNEMWDYVAVDNPERAENLIRKIYSTLETIALNPEMGRTRHEIENKLRSFPMGRYVAFYEVCNEGIEVIRILHGSRDLENANFS